MSNQKIFDQLLIFVNFYHHAKNKAVSLIFSGEMVDLKILQSEWLRAFWSIPHEKDLSQREYLGRNTANNINFHYRTKSGKINDQSSLKLKKTIWPIFCPFPQFFLQIKLR